MATFSTETSQASQPIGRKRGHDDDGNDPDRPSAKRKQVAVAKHRGHTDSSVNDESDRNLVQHPAQPTTSQAGLFPQFSKLPPELRRKIWRETWEHRRVNVIRGSGGISLKVISGSSYSVDHKAVRVKHLRRTQQDWGIAENSYEDLIMPYDIVTDTRSKQPPPLSLWVNQESRNETLMRFKVAFGLPGAKSTVLFNFDLDMLVFPLHNPLSSAFSVLDLRRLRYLTIPELVPMLPFFTHITGPWDTMPQRVLPQADNEDKQVCYPEFKYAWRLLRRYFPSLREIHLSGFIDCQRYTTTWRPRNTPLNLGLPTHGNVSIRYVDGHCHSCSNIQNAADRFFPRTNALDPRTDLKRMLDRHGIKSPGIRRESLVIGRVACEEGHGKEEDVLVTYRVVVQLKDAGAAQSQPSQSSDPDSKKRLHDYWNFVKRKCIARTLEHALEPPADLDYMVYKINDIGPRPPGIA
ncbi:hypothetical protein GGS26DRAFT_544522 [Hypomontagnella submonticulosa]|nr:hypothetical protein GGS26DRAFT_544522 [Hypomontagnella submonticulosa]